MKNCLVTTYKASVNDDSLSRLGCLKVDFTSGIDYVDNYFTVVFSDDFDNASTEWIGGSSKPISKLDNAITVYKTEAVNDSLIIKPKYGISIISSEYSNAKINLRELIGLSKLTVLSLGVNNDDNVNLIPADLPLKIISVAYLSGDIAHLSNFQDLEMLMLKFYKKGLVSKIEGKLSDISNLLKLKSVIVPVHVTGTISDLRCYSTLESFNRENNVGGVDSDASLWANKFTVLNSITDWTTPIKWSSPTLRSSEYCLINVQVKFATSSDTDNYLINMASCLDNGLYPSSRSKEFYLQNSHRTFASDAAVQKLTEAGFSIYQVVVD